jgi:hypothetical protein
MLHSEWLIMSVSVFLYRYVEQSAVFTVKLQCLQYSTLHKTLTYIYRVIKNSLCT